MTPATNDSLARAIDSLGAVQVAPGKYAMTWGRRWYVTDGDGVQLTKLLGGGEMIATGSVPMPAWWSPEQRFAWRLVYADGRFGAPERDEVTAQNQAYATFERIERITADLKTGAEVPA